MKEDIKNEINKYVNNFANVVGSTFGPGGYNVLISNDTGNFLTKDGVTVARNLNSTNYLETAVYNLMREACEKTVSTCGDGTTTTAILTSAFFNSFINLMDTNIDRNLFFKEFDQVINIMINELSKEIVDIKDYEDIYRVALLSSNKDLELARLVADTLESIGVDGSVKIEESKNGKSYVDIHDGYHFNSGYSSFEFCNTDRYTVEFDEPVILVYNGKLNFGSQFKDLVQSLIELNKPIVIVANEFDEKVLATLIYNKNKTGFNILAIQAPYFGLKKKSSLEDLSVMIGATLFDDSLMPLTELDPSKHLGTCKSLTCSKNKTLFIESNFNETRYEFWLEKLKSDLEESVDEKTQQELTYRISQLSSSAVIIYLSGNTPSEILEKRHRLEDALSAATTAIRGGIVVAGGGPLIRTVKNIKNMNIENIENITLIYKIIENSIFGLYDKLYGNLGTHTQYIRNKLLNSSKYDYCNYETMEISNNMKYIEPFYMLKQSINNSLSIAKLLFSCNAFIVNKS